MTTDTVEIGATPAAGRVGSSPGVLEPAALWVGLIALAGSLYMSIGMGLNACPLCFYQRTFIIAVVGVLGVGRLMETTRPSGSLSVLALPLAVAGGAVAVAHNWLVWSGTLVCPPGIFGLGTAPLQSLLAFVLVVALLVVGAARAQGQRLSPLPRVLVLVGVGVIFALLCILSSPKLPPFKPTYDAAGNRVLIMCERAQPQAPAP